MSAAPTPVPWTGDYDEDLNTATLDALVGFVEFLDSMATRAKYWRWHGPKLHYLANGILSVPIDHDDPAALDAFGDLTQAFLTRVAEIRAVFEAERATRRAAEPPGPAEIPPPPNVCESCDFYAPLWVCPACGHHNSEVDR
jgi:hypothetical protein